MSWFFLSESNSYGIEILVQLLKKLNSTELVIFSESNTFRLTSVDQFQNKRFQWVYFLVMGKKEYINRIDT